LAAAAGPLAADLALHEELRRHDVKPLADVLAHADHRLAALWRRAICALGLDALLHARQVCRLWLALGWRRGSLSGAVPPAAALCCRCARWASRLAWSAASVSSDRLCCSAFMASVLAPNFQARMSMGCTASHRASTLITPQPLAQPGRAVAAALHGPEDVHGRGVDKR